VGRSGSAAPPMASPSSRRAPRAAVLVAVVAVVSAAVVLALGFDTTTSIPAGVPRGADLLTVSGTPVSRPVAPGYIGLSLEYTAVEHYAGTDPTAIDPVFVRLLDGLTPGGHPVLRIGGDTSDWGWFAVPGMRKPRGIRFTLHRRWVSVTRALAARTGAKLILGLNLEAASRRLMAVQIHRFRGVGRQALQAYEIGNEPEVFGALGWYRRAHHPVYARRRGYNYRDYTRELTRYSRLVPAGIPLAGPSTGGTKFWAQTGNFLREHPRVRVVTFHLYPLHECLVNPKGPTASTIPHLLAPPASTGLAALIAPYVKVAHAHGAVVRIDELNSVSCGGGPGVSDRFASALWAIDTLFALAREGVDGVNFHTFTHAYYRPFIFHHIDGRWSATVDPMYYGMLAFNLAAPAGSKLLQTSAPASSTLRVWATRGSDGRVRVMLINTSPQQARTIAIKLPAGSPRAPATLQRLRSPGLSSAQGITLGGQRFAQPTTTGQLTGPRVVSTPRQVERGVYLLALPPGSAAVLTR